MSYFQEDRYTIRRKIFKLFGGAFHIYDAAGRVVGYTKMKAFKLKEDLRMYESEDMQKEIFSIQARHVIDFAATYDVSANGAPVGALQRKGLKSIIKDEWFILDTQNRKIGLITEDNAGLALVRRFLCNLVPQSFDCQLGGEKVCVFKQHFNPFVMKMTVTFHHHDDAHRDLLMAAGILLCAIEGRQK
ncbi:MAG: hypothetical protein RRC34_10030 [Lentisphaeria bacterium]|nr:hypothetical protein [Lentisphaeria bacterium]